MSNLDKLTFCSVTFILILLKNKLEIMTMYIKSLDLTTRLLVYYRSAYYLYFYCVNFAINDVPRNIRENAHHTLIYL